MTITDNEFFTLAHSLISHDYTTAKTMPNNPHQYTLRKTWNDAEFCHTVELLREHGYTKSFYGKDYTCFDVNGYRYWTMGEPINKNGKPHTILINRAKNKNKAAYDDMAAGYDGVYNNLFFLEENNTVMEMVGWHPGESVLDIGCGTGLFLDYNECKNYVGIDPSRGMLDELHRKHPDAYLLDTGFEDFYLPNRFDRVIGLFGAPSYIEPSTIGRVNSYTNGFGMLMFYKDGYRPVNYGAFKKTIPHHSFSEYEPYLDGWKVSEWHEYLIAARQ